MNFKKLAHQMFARLGVQVRPLRSVHFDPEGDMKRLLTGAEIKTIFDVGAFDGGTAQRYRRHFPQARIFSFEPSDAAYRQLEHALTGDRAFVATKAAVSDAPGEATFYINAHDQTNSLLPNHQRVASIIPESQSRTLSSTTVPVIRIDDFCRQHGVQTIDIMKMDIQGNELKALRGAESLLKDGAIRLIYAEVMFSPQYQGQAYYHDIACYLYPFGYELFGFYETIRGRNGVLGWGDALFMNNEVTARLYR